jgi:predicted Zn-dependent protease
MIASEDFRKYGEYAMQGMQLLFLSFSRENEREADRLGVEYASKIGYDANKMADFYQVLVKMNLASNQSGVPTFLSTHPDPGDRYNSVKRDAAKWQDSLNLSSWQVNTDAYLQLINGMVYGEDPRQGYKEGSVFYHPEMKFRFTVPPTWKLENSPIQVKMYPEGGNALMIFALAQGETLDEAATATLKRLQLELRESSNTTVNGMPAISVVSAQTGQNSSTGQQQTVKVLSYFINYGGNYYVFHGLSMEEEFNEYSAIFRPSMASFNKLTDPSKINVLPKRIRVKTVQNPGTLENALRSFGVQQEDLKEMAFLNNMELADQVSVGTLVKTIGQ